MDSKLCGSSAIKVMSLENEVERASGRCGCAAKEEPLRMCWKQRKGAGDSHPTQRFYFSGHRCAHYRRRVSSCVQFDAFPHLKTFPLAYFLTTRRATTSGRSKGTRMLCSTVHFRRMGRFWQRARQISRSSGLSTFACVVRSMVTTTQYLDYHFAKRRHELCWDLARAIRRSRYLGYKDRVFASER